jgi:hypothetical protein
MPEYLGPLLSDPSRLRREAVTRRKLFVEKSIPPQCIAEYEASGWQVDRTLKRVTKVKREKPIDERLEDRFWMLLFKMGYPELSELRRIPAHPARERKYKVEDFEYINFIYEELMKRIKEAQANPVLEMVAAEGEEDA